LRRSISVRWRGTQWAIAFIKSKAPPKTTDGVLQFQLDILKHELDTVAEIIGRIDHITQTTKNWAIVTWTGSVGLALTQTDLRQYVIITAVLPLLFWFIDAWWRRLQRRSVYRSQQITAFLNDERLVQSFAEKRVVGFDVFDPVGVSHKGDDEYKNTVTLRKTLFFPEVAVFHLTLAVISIGLGVRFLLWN